MPNTTVQLEPLQPLDEHNRVLKANVRPGDWKNPTPSEIYNLVVIGAGTAGLVAAAGAAGLGARVALIERELMGGDCLNVGCVPSKGVISAARAAAKVHRAGEFGVRVPDGTEVDFAAVMQRMRRLRAQIAPNDSAKRFAELGIDVYFGQGEFTSANTIEVADQTLRFKKAVIATGARAAAPPIDGLETIHYLTNETVFSLTEIPKKFGIVGAGPIGAELAQAFARLGSEVILLQRGPHILNREDPDAAAIVQKRLLADGVRVFCNAKDLKLLTDDGGVQLVVDSEGRRVKQRVDQLLVAVGRAPNIETLSLERAGVDYTKHGVTVNDRLQTTNRNIYAAGDVCSKYKFTHAADFLARIVIQNALFYGRARASKLLIPWCTYTSPEIAHVGMYPRNAASQGAAIDTYVQEFADVDRAILDGETEGLVKVHVRKGTDRIVGATIVAAHAGDMISEITLAMRHNIGLGRIGATIHPYPTQAEAIRKLGDQHSRTRLTPLTKRLLRWVGGFPKPTT